MASYQIELKFSALKELEKLPRQVLPRAIAAIKRLAENPYPPGVKKLAGFERTYRVRVGDYRIMYEIYEDRLIIEIIRVKHRRDVYRR
ncbi:MAG: type II toxin-antitoxin system RelE/ParE family toxin [Anaerolineales bacterium]|nr:type II toxin-antitoxin system RelE/ParE family toxin [Anaerolineales bacterium]